MENNKSLNLGPGLLTVLIIELIFSSIGMVMIFLSLFIARKQLLEATKGSPTHASYLLITLIIMIIVIIGVILILSKKKIGVFTYFIAQVAVIINMIANSGLHLNIVFSFIIPVLMAIFIWHKKELFGFISKY